MYSKIFPLRRLINVKKGPKSIQIAEVVPMEFALTEGSNDTKNDSNDVVKFIKLKVWIKVDT